MENRIRKYNRIAAIVLFIALPVIIYAMGDFPRRSFLKESISLITILAFFIMLMQFYLSQANKAILKGHKMGKVVRWHKVLGYIFVSILLLHPFCIILPRFFEAGIDPKDAFITLITTYDILGVILGISAWALMLILGITSIFRNRLGLKYKSWRVFHGILSAIFIAIASFHVINMGRHINSFMTILIGALAITSIALLLKIYIFKPAS